MNIKNELKIYADRIEDYNRMKIKAEREFLDLAFKHRKEYALPVPNDKYESWDEYDKEEGVDYMSELPTFVNIWDHHGYCHEIYPTNVYRDYAAIYVDGYDLSLSDWVEDWEVQNISEVVDFITAVLEAEEDDRHFTTITYDGKEYWLRQVLSNEGTLLIGDTKLYDTLHPGSFEDADGGWASKEAERIDEQIFYYVSPDELMLPKEELIAVLKDSNPDLFE